MNDQIAISINFFSYLLKTQIISNTNSNDLSLYVMQLPRA